MLGGYYFFRDREKTAMRDARREDWPRLIGEIGLTPWKLAITLGVDPKTVRNYIDKGGEPAHCIGEEIKRLHAECVSRETGITPGSLPTYEYDKSKCSQ